ncbi:MAG: hypothetical protein PHV17_05985 [Candidatus Omnitrophica bacterium]|nr:hypothetical protein [Candidatus Omnitrophota bacterium]
MPGRDGRGPIGQGPKMGKGLGRGAGNRLGLGSGGNCVCPDCGEKVAHQAGKPCASMNCPKCGVRMVRD